MLKVSVLSPRASLMVPELIDHGTKSVGRQ